MANFLLTSNSRHRKQHDKPCKCNICEKGFSKNSDLARHRLTHTSSAPTFKCLHPGCSFPGTGRKDYLWSHIKKEHSTPGDVLEERLRSYYNRSKAEEERQSIQSMQDVDFLEAVHQGNKESLTGLLSQSKMWLSVKDSSGRSALHIAAIAGHQIVVELLIGHGADINALDRVGKSALHHASQAGHDDLVKVLLQWGAEVNAVDSSGKSVLHHASQAGHDDVVKALLQSGAEVNALDRRYQRSALHLAASAGHKGVAKLLIQNGANTNAQGGWNDETVLHVAVGGPNCAAMVELLLINGADVNITTNRSYYATALHRAVLRGYETTKLLLDANAEVEAMDSGGRTPLSFAIGRIWSAAEYSAERFHDQTTKLLLEAGAKFSPEDWVFLPPDRREQFADYCPMLYQKLRP
ncbi:ankyrin repeat domain-containing protein [Rutstroemia sp. NJR-2017a BVV2]|nr:ankyrin repeat domain-containing protein [Rutstroemia sp. NJR-2017a BVV2]